MAEERKYRLRVEGHLVEVTKDVYLTYYRVERHTKTLDEKDVRNGKVSYSDLDTEETLGEEMVPDPNAESVEDKAVGNILISEAMGTALAPCFSLRLMRIFLRYEF